MAKKENASDTNSQKIKKKPTENDLLKYELAEELGLMEKITNSGWRSLTAKESGKIGGMIAKRKKERL